MKNLKFLFQCVCCTFVMIILAETFLVAIGASLHVLGISDFSSFFSIGG